MSLPLRGEFLVVELDPLESLRPIIDDPEVLKACQALKLQTRKYVVCIIQRMGIAVVGALHPLEVAMVSRGFVPGPDEFVLSDMSIPVLPNTHHPRDRTPLVCDPPLPWDNCYIQTLALLPIRIKFSDPTPRARGKYWLNPPRQAGLIHFQCGDDNDWRDKLVRTAEMGGSDFEPDTYPGDEFDEPEGEPCYPWDNSEDTASLAVLESSKELAVDSKLNVTPSDIESVSDRASLHSAYAKSVVGFDEMVHQYDFTPVVNFSLDLEILSADEIPNPWEFFGEVDALEHQSASQNRCRREVERRVRQ
ncbi:hypothetical protein BDZ89DRAFT_435132 [Hymenopellis radicata]|nr:hypothetical protein BDZ89DRAFT_435132 [Hymenopellis radicata]